MVDFPQGMVHFYQDPHSTRNMSMHHIRYFHIPMYIIRHPLLFKYHIHLFYFLVLYLLKLLPDQAEFHLDPHK